MVSLYASKVLVKRICQNLFEKHQIPLFLIVFQIRTFLVMVLIYINKLKLLLKYIKLKYFHHINRTSINSQERSKTILRYLTLENLLNS
jgi:hypothetical protein